MKKIKNENIEMKGAEMEEIEVGEYIRLKQGDIGIIKNINGFREPSMKYAVDIQKKDFAFVGDDDIAKHSKQLEDLIEVGDIVNQEEVIEVRKQDGKIYLMTGYVPQSYIKDGIKTILTKEIYMANCYKVGGENEDRRANKE